MDITAYHAAVDHLEQMLSEGAGWSGKERNVFFLNTQGERFADASAVSGLDFPDDARACGKVDWDGDGDLDLWIVNRNGPQVRFMRNDAQRTNHFVEFDLAATAPGTNIDAIGARVELYVVGDARPMLRTLRAGEGFLSQGSKTVHFGLGASAAIDRVSVRWPGGATERFEGVAADGRFRLKQGSGRATAIAAPPAGAPLAAKALPNTKVSAQSRSILSMRLPFPRLPYEDASGKPRTLEFATAKPLLIVVWTSWCCRCSEELDALVKARSSLDSVRVLALSLDEADDNPADKAAALALAKEKGFQWPVGFLDAGGVERVRGFYSALYPRHPPLPTPASFLLDGSGRLVAFYKGAVDPQQLVADLRFVTAPVESLLDLSLPLGGRRYSSPAPYTALDFARQLLIVAGPKIAAEYLDDRCGEALLTSNRDQIAIAHELRLKLSRHAREAGDLEGALRQGEAALKLFADSPLAHLRVGELLFALQRDLPTAEQHLARAVALDPQLTAAAAAARATGGTK